MQVECSTWPVLTNLVAVKILKAVYFSDLLMIKLRLLYKYEMESKNSSLKWNYDPCFLTFSSNRLRGSHRSCELYSGPFGIFRWDISNFTFLIHAEISNRLGGNFQLFLIHMLNSSRKLFQSVEVLHSRKFWHSCDLW